MTTATLEPRPAPGPAPTGRDYLSFSAIKLYQTCSLKFYMRYCLGLPEETVAASLVLGGSLHRAIELHFRELLAGNPPPPLDAMLTEFWSEWRQRETQQIRFGKDEERVRPPKIETGLLGLGEDLDDLA